MIIQTIFMYKVELDYIYFAFLIARIFIINIFPYLNRLGFERVLNFNHIDGSFYKLLLSISHYTVCIVCTSTATSPSM